MVFDGERRHRGQAMTFPETLRRLAMIDEGFVEDQAGLGLGPAAASALSQDRGVAASRSVGDPRVAGGLPVTERHRALAAGARGRDRRCAAGDRPTGRARPGRRRRTGERRVLPLAFTSALNPKLLAVDLLLAENLRQQEPLA
jgi:hypothetical protein